MLGSAEAGADADGPGEAGGAVVAVAPGRAPRAVGGRHADAGGGRIRVGLETGRDQHDAERGQERREQARATATRTGTMTPEA